MLSSIIPSIGRAEKRASTPAEDRPRAVSAKAAVLTPPARPAEAAVAEMKAGENRAAPRVPASEVPEITGVRFSPRGVEAKLVNISSTGILVECAERLTPRSALTVVFEGTFQPRAIEARIARSSVSAIGADGRLRYHVGVAFRKPIELNLPNREAPAEETSAPIAAAPPRVVRNRW